jgi:GPH family glycoside/pentoside/hexuronide:cation symporter
MRVTGVAVLAQIDAEKARRGQRVALRTGLGYGIGMVGERMFRDAPALLLLVFMTNYLGIPAAWAGVAIFVPKLLLVFVDPYVGFRSDLSGSGSGRRRPFLALGAFLSAAAFVLMFNVPRIAGTPLRTVYMIVLIGTAFAVYSIYSVPYLALASDLSSDPYQRTRLLAFRMAFLAVGLNLSASAGVLIERFGGGITGYSRMSVLYGVICLLTMLSPVLLLRERPAAARDGGETGYLAAMRVVLADRGYRRLLLVNFVQKISEGVGYGSFAYFFLYWLDQPMSAIGACVLASTAAQILSQPVWVAASRRISRAGCCMVSLGGYLVSNALWLLVPPRLFWPVPVVGFFAGCFASGLMLMLLAMMSDVAVGQRTTSDTRFEGLISGSWLAVEKIGFAAGGLFVGLTLSAFGFTESVRGLEAVQSSTARIGIAISYVGLGTLFYLLTLVLIIRMRRSPWKT